MSFFNEAVDHVLKAEGGFVDDPADSGGATRYGITEAQARAWGYTGEMSKLPLETAKAIYRARYWNVLKCDAIAEKSYPVALKMFDIGVNCGVGAAAEWFQRSLNVLNNGGNLWPDIEVDKSIGPKTIAAFEALHSKRGVKGMEVLRRALNAFQGCHYLTLAERRAKDEKFVYGWILNRIS